MIKCALIFFISLVFADDMLIVDEEEIDDRDDVLIIDKLNSDEFYEFVIEQKNKKVTTLTMPLDTKQNTVANKHGKSNFVTDISQLPLCDGDKISSGFCWND